MSRLSARDVADLIQATLQHLGRPRNYGEGLRMLRRDKVVFLDTPTPYPGGEWRYATIGWQLDHEDLRVLDGDTPGRIVDVISVRRQAAIADVVGFIEGNAPPGDDVRLAVLEGTWMRETCVQTPAMGTVVHLDCTFAYGTVANLPVHDLGDDGICHKCGAFEWELREARMLLCTGNVYICRVARAIKTVRPRRCEDRLKDVGGGMWYHAPLLPWKMTAEDLWYVVDGVVGIASNDTIAALVLAIKTSPDRCPILADALEEAGCEDSALLQALRVQ